MKAEHRKELQTNVLADHMGRFLKSMRSGPKTTPIIVWVILGLAVGVVAAWLYFRNSGTPLPWNELYSVNELSGNALDTKVKDISKKNHGTPLSRVARFEQARDLLRRGQEDLCARPAEARGLLEKASELYEQLALEATAQPLLAQEALMGAAQAEEGRGNLKRAQELYQKLADTYPKSALGEVAKKNAQELEEEFADGGGPKIDFYKKLDAQIAEAGKRPEPSDSALPPLLP
jgi:hypothetical protein